MDQGRRTRRGRFCCAPLPEIGPLRMVHHLIAGVYEIIGNRDEELKHLKRAYELRARLLPRRAISSRVVIAWQTKSRNSGN